MKILFVNTNIGYGGASKIMAWVANLCANSGDEVSFVTYRDSVVCQILDSRVKHIHFQLENGREKHFLKTIWFIHNYLKKERFDWAVAFLTPSQLRLAIAGLFTGTKILFSQRGDPYQKGTGLVGFFSHYVNNFFFCLASFFVFQTEFAAKYYPSFVRRKSQIIPNAIKPLHRTIKRNINEKRIVCVARLDVYQKRQDIVIKAFNVVSKKFPNYTLEFWGDGPVEDEMMLKKLAEGNNQIKFMGKVISLVDTVQNASMGVLASDFEGFPNILLEYMSLGVPCISTDCSPGGASCIINNGVNGLLIPRGDVCKLASAIEFLITNPSLAEHMGENGQKINEIYSEDVIGKQWKQIFLEKK